LDNNQRQEMLDVGFETIPLNKAKENAYILVGSRYREQRPPDSIFKFISLKEVVEIIAGQSPDGIYYNTAGDGMAFYQGNADFGSVYINAPQKWTTQITKKSVAGDILLSVRAPVGAVNICNGEICIGRGIMALRPKTDIIDTHFLFYVLKGASRKLRKFSAGSTFDAVTKKDVEDFIIPVPLLEIQQQIVDELDGYQRIIDGARMVIRSYKQTISINPIWDRVKLGDLFDTIGENIEPQNIQGNVDYIGLENIKSDSGELIGEIKTDAQIIKSTKKRFFKGDILYGKLRPNLNKVYVATFDGICSTDIIVLRLKNAKIIPEFYAILLRSKQFNDAVLNGVSGGQLPRVDTNYFLTIPIYNVPLSEQKKVVAQIETEQALVESSKQLIDVFAKKMQDRINEIWGE
jgi:type I restriction enzyme M protein